MATTPTPIDCVRKLSRALELAAIRSGADEIGVAELTNRARAIFLSARPEIAAAESTEDRGAPSLRALALQRVEDLFDRVGHCAALRVVA